MPETCSFTVTPLPVHLCRFLSPFVVPRELKQSRILSHCSVHAAPPGRMASLLNHGPVILPELSFQKAQPLLCTLPTRSSGTSANLCFFPPCLCCAIGRPGFESSCWGQLIAVLCYCVMDLLTHVFGLIPGVSIVGAALCVLHPFHACFSWRRNSFLFNECLVVFLLNIIWGL